MMGFQWDAENTDKLKTMWAEGLTCAEIAWKLSVGEITRNAVIGKVHRLGLPHRAIQPKMSDKQKILRRERKEKVLKAYDQAPRIIYPKAPKKMVAPPNSKHVTLENRTGCCWPVNDGGPFLFCNAPQHGNGSYCEFHHAKSIKVREEVAA